MPEHDGDGLGKHFETLDGFYLTALFMRLASLDFGKIQRGTVLQKGK